MSKPPLPPGYSLSDAPRRNRREPAPPDGFRVEGEEKVPAPPRGYTLDRLTGEAVDGDTLRMENGGNMRLYGADAPELRQQGWLRDMTRIDIGEGAQRALDRLATPATLPGPLAGMSYGRPVAPATTDGLDLGLDQIRTGNALAAPDYLRSDPQRRFQYMQAERLARLNRQGLHGTFAQTPEDFRRAPIYQPDRETVARFWDTPTPFAGLRPEIESEFLRLINDHSVPPEKVEEFARANGFITSTADLLKNRAQSRKTGLAITLGYNDRPKVLTDEGDGALGAAFRGVGNGVLPNMLEELGAVPDTLGLTSGRENIWNSDRRLADIWQNNYQQNEAITAFDRSEHPWASIGGEVAGSLAPIGRVKNLADLAKFGAGYGLVSGLGQDGTIPERLTSGTIGLGLGLTTAVAGGKALEAASPYVGRAWQRLTGKSVPAAPVSLADDIPAPPEGFDTAIPMAADAGPVATQDLPRQRDYLFPQRPQLIDQPISEAQLRAASETVAPGDVVPIPSNEVGSVEEAIAAQAGRYVEAKGPNERTELTRRTVRAWNGAEVPKVGPVDMVGWLRLNGGLADQGGELSHMGLTNATRPDRLDFVGQETRFGPLVSDQGMNLDDAAMRAWEAGYFPEMTERPTVNEFLDALRDTYEGRNRRFLADDLPEIERFENARAERYAIEQQRFETGQPVYRDNSYPADDQPFPPISAYEEWPAGGPDFAGNIRLEKLESPQDISRALDFTNRRVGFDAATRGRISQAETEHLAADLGMTPERLLSRRKGQALNAEEALAARQILAKSGNELVNAAKRIQGLDVPGDELVADFQQKWMRHVAIQEQVAGATAEAGRALSQFRMVASSRAVRGDVLAALVRGGGGTDRIRQAADILIDAVEQGPGKFNTLAEQMTKPRFKDKLVELWINSLLSGPQTHAVNIVSNTLTSLLQLPEHAAAAAIGGARRLAGRGEDAVLGNEVTARAFGLLQGAKEGARFFAQAIKTGEPADFVSKVEAQDLKAISGTKGKIVRIPTHLLTAEDEFFKGVARRMELNGEAVRIAHREGLRGEAAKRRIAELIDLPTEGMLARSMDYARYLTFQRKLGPMASKVSALTQVSPALKLFLPFVRTPTNLLKFAAERSPAAPLLREWRADWFAGGARRDLAISKMMLGTGLGMAIYEGALAGKITGSAPSDPTKARLQYADGWQPYSIRIGDTWYSYKRLDPLSTTLGVAADLATLPEGMSKREQDDRVTLLVASIMGNLASKTWLSGISDVVGAISDPDQNAQRLVKRLAGSIAVPTGIAQVARTIDPVARESDTVGEYVQSRLPGLSRKLPPRRDVWGREVVNEGGVGPDILSPVWTSTAKDDPLNRELLGAGISVGLPQRKIGDRELTAAEYDRYQAAAGKIAVPRLRSLTASTVWKGMDGEAKQDSVSMVMRQARSEARASLFGGPPRKGARATVPSLPAGFVVEGAAGGRNVYVDLQKAIPGLRFQSGYRTRAYQEDMKRRGYRPSDNSRHLDGSSFDLLPPPGKSMDWLKGQLRRFDPNVRLLDEGDHLHTTFPGYYGAPPLGGARKAGLRNPLQGMPPPPDGFKLDAR